MPESKSGSNLRQVTHWQKAAARTEYLRHPDASISDVARATGVNVRTVARARAELVKEGLLPAGRNAAASGADAAALALAALGGSPGPPADVTGGSAADVTGGPDEPGQAQPAQPSTTPASRRGGQTIDGEALRQMNAMLDELADEDDEKTRDRMLRQCKRFAFDPNLHPDTRMSASQMWAKLLDMKRAKDLGPGSPVNLALAIDRATDFLRACGAKVAVPAFYRAFDLGEAPGNDASQAVVEGQPAPAPAVAAGPADDDAQARPEA